MSIRTIILSGLCLFLLTSCDSPTTIPFTLQGESTIVLSLGEPYVEPGYTLTTDDSNVTPTIRGEVDIHTVGEYDIIYTVVYNNKEYVRTRTVIVENRLLRYFDQEPPGTTPVPFAPGIVTTDLYSEFAGTFSPDYTYYFFTRRNEYNDNRILYSVFENGVWNEPTLSPISQEIAEMEPYITIDGTTLYFSSKREGHTSTAIFMSQYINQEWTEAAFVDTGLNDEFAMYISVSDNQNLYFTTMDSKIYVMTYENGTYQTPQFTGVHGAHSFISGDESFMIVDDSNLTNTYTKLYIVFQEDGIWGTPIELDASINTDGYNNICPSISPDGQYLFFSRFRGGNSDIYWVSMEILDPYFE